MLCADKWSCADRAGAVPATIGLVRSVSTSSRLWFYTLFDGSRNPLFFWLYTVFDGSRNPPFLWFNTLHDGSRSPPLLIASWAALPPPVATCDGLSAHAWRCDKSAGQQHHSRDVYRPQRVQARSVGASETASPVRRRLSADVAVVLADKFAVFMLAR